MKRILRLAIRLLALGLAMNAALRADDIHVFAAASLSDALKDIAATYEPASGDKLVLNLAASSVLARQIKEGAPADLFFSADEAKMDDLAKAELLIPDTRRSLLGNTLVVVVAADSPLTLSSPTDLTSSAIRRLALGETRTVPAGVYAREYLEHAGLWEKLSDRIVPSENVRACLAAVEAGNADAGVVYKTDALISRKVKIAWEIPSAAGPVISYPLALVKDAPHPDAARRLAAHLASPEAAAVFQKHGFLPAPAPAAAK